MGAWRVISRDLSARAWHLHSVGAELPLSEVLELTGRLRQDADCLAAVAVDEARQRGWAWREVAAEAALSEASARARWGGVRVPRLVAARVPLISTPPVGKETPAPVAGDCTLGPAASAAWGEARAIDEALRTLNERSGASAHEGQAKPAWPVISEILTVLGADLSSFESLWAEARAAQLAAREGEG
jgi:hypothetical protein